MTPLPQVTNRSLLVPYALPYVLYIAVASIPSDWMGRELNYALRLGASGAALVWAWRHYAPLRGPRPVPGSIATGVVAGLLGTLLWVAMLATLVPAGGDPWPELAFGLRLVAATALVPVFEEMLMRGYVLRLALQWEEARRSGAEDAFGEALHNRSVNDVLAGAATPTAVAISTAIFMAGHGLEEMPAAMAYGLLMAGLWVVRKDLLTCVVAHATTNLALALYVRASGHWALW